MADEDEWKKLSSDQKVQHTSWKARAEGYKECIKNFQKYDEKSPEFSKYLGLVKKFVTDTNELNRVQGLKATLLFVQRAHCAGKTGGEVISGILAKCFNSKPKLREMGIEVCVMYIEIDKNELAIEELLKGLSNKQPKIVHACLDAIVKGLSEFGTKVISVKPIIKQSIKLLDHRDKNVRESTKSLFVEIYKWIGTAIQTPLQGINPVVLKELEVEWEKLGSGGNAKQTRFMRSQQDLREKMEAKAAECEQAGGDAEQGDVAEVVDPYDLLEPKEILSQLPKGFYEKIEEKKWQERKLVLEPCEALTSFPRISPGDYGDFVKALKKVVSKDTNIMLVTIAVKCLGGLATGLRKKFQPYSILCLDAMLEKFKEKKITVVTALREAVDAIFLSTTIQAISETCVEFLQHKNPAIRAQTGYFLSRSLSKTKAALMNKALMKLFIQPLLKNIDHSTPDVRDSAYQSIGMMSKLVGESKLQQFIGDLDKLKLDKINEYAGKAVVGSAKAAQTNGGAKQTPAPEKATTSKQVTSKTAKTAPAKTTTSSAKPKTVKGGKKATPKSQSVEVASEQELGDEAVEELVSAHISAEEKSQITNMNWKERLAGLQSTFQKLKMLEKNTIPCQAFVRFLSLKPGWKDNNFNCLNEKFKILEFLALNAKFTRTSANVCLSSTVDKIGDVKCGLSAKTALSAICEATQFSWVVDQVIECAMGQKNPKIQSESLQWFAANIKEFGLTGVNVKFVIDKLKVALAATNPAVRTAALSVIGTLAMYIGDKVRMFFESEKPTLLQQIDSEIEKVKGSSPPAPTRGTKTSSAADSVDAAASDDEVEEAFNIDNMVTRVDISSKITDSLITKMSDKNWKERKEALETVIGILDEAKFVEANIGDLPVALKARLVDSNKILLTTTVNILTQLAKALGPHCSKHLPIILSNLIAVLADSKPQVRQAALKCMDEWSENTKISMWLEGDNISSALAVAKQTFLRIELFNWLSDKLGAAKKLPTSSKEGLEGCITVLYSCCEDRSGEVRAKAQAFIPVIMKHLSYDKMLHGTSKLGASSKSTIVALLEKAREQMPPPPAKTNKKASTTTSTTKQVVAEIPDKEETKTSNTGTSKNQTAKEKRTTNKRPTTTSKKQAAEEDTSPLFIPNQNGKEQRMKDEIKLKTIKWNFPTPREDLVTQLQQQLVPCVSSTLMSEMFHADFQHHLKAISMLSQAMSSDWASTVNCMDILLRWFTLRFYDKNTTVHIKCLEYIKVLFDKLIENSYKASDYELASFLPHLMIKIGENKDNIRKAVHGILKQVSNVYPASKLFNYIMDGIKSKNSRQRSECLDHIALLIETYGVSVCQPSAAKALKEIATNISDRDKGVRSSSLNAIVAAYNVSGDIVFKQVGRLNEKDMSMLEERVKRSGKFSENPPQQAVKAPASATNVVKKEKETKSQLPPSKQQIAQPAPSHSLNSLSEHTSSTVGMTDPLQIPEVAALLSQIQEVNIDQFLVPIEVPDCIKEFRAKQAQENSKKTLDVVISQLASPQIDASTTAAHQLYAVISRKDKWPMLEGKMDDLLTATCTQLRMITDRYLPMILKAQENREVAEISNESFFSLTKSNFSVLMCIFSAPVLASQASVYVMFDLLRTIVQLLINEQLNSLSEKDVGKLTQTMNMLVHRMLENCDPTAISCAIIRVLHDSMEAASKSYADVVVKCLWKFGRSVESLVSDKGPSSTGDGFQQQQLNIAALMAEMDRFWRFFPKTHPVYARIENDFPLRSVKTVVVIFCKQMGPKLADHLYMISNPESSDVVATVQKYSKMSMGDMKRRIAVSSERKENIYSLSTKSLEAKLSEIFKKVGHWRHCKQGVEELYDFQQDNPGFNIKPYLDLLDVAYRDYVKLALQKVESERTGVPIPEKPPVKDLFAYLNGLRQKAGLPSLSREQIRAQIDQEKDADNCVQTKILAPNTTANQSQNLQSDVPTTSTRTGPTSSGLMDLKRRLEEIKQGINRT
uniref:Cytoskeleton-associated protein 5-like n=1 Tax=Phallusia mammillata TaxID=59560 RepID=A0A6F9DA15_9ASCI|nr:cytoskeleton-associated protein 5-like [Phallusia mammillata]